MKSWYVYILASQKNGTIYVGVTSNLIKRISEHKEWNIEGFTQKYNCKILVHYEYFDDIETAILREKQIKKYNRQKKLALFENYNPKWNDLFDEVCKIY